MSKRIYGIEQQIYMLIFLGIFLFSFVLMAGTLASKSWVYTTVRVYIYSGSYNDWHNKIINLRIFEGNLYRCTESCTETYKKLSSEFCHSVERNYVYYPENYFMCRLFKDLNKGMKIYLICECFAMFCLFLVAILLVFSRRSFRMILLYIIYTLLTLVVFAHYTGFISWMSVTNTNFNRDCVEFPHNASENMNLCAGDGPALALFLAILLPLTSILFCFLSRSFRTNKIKEKIENKSENHEKDIEVIEIDSDKNIENQKLNEESHHEKVVTKFIIDNEGTEMPKISA